MNAGREEKRGVRGARLMISRTSGRRMDAVMELALGVTMQSLLSLSPLMTQSPMYP